MITTEQKHNHNNVEKTRF